MKDRPVRILAVSDETVDRPFDGPVDLLVSCGDLPYDYLELVASSTNAPLVFVHGNHDPPVQYTEAGAGLREPPGEDLDRRCLERAGLLLAGLEGCVRYREGAPHQYSEREMARRATSLLPGLLRNRLRRGRWLDVLVTHAPPRGIHDAADRAHAGFRSFLRIMGLFRPRLLLHGHHRVHPGRPRETRFGATTVVNVLPYRVIDVGVAAGGHPGPAR